MNKLNVVFVLVLCITVSVACVATVQAGSRMVFSMPEENDNIILTGNASYVESGTQYYYDNRTEPQIPVWYLPMFTTGNGTANIYASTHNCNLTVNSFKQTTAPMETQYMYNVSSSVDCTVAGDGVAHINADSLNSNLAVYIDGVLRHPGDGWTLTEEYIALQGPANVTIYSSTTDYWPPRNAPHDEMFPYDWVLSVAATVIILIIGLLAYRRHLRKQHKTV